MNLQKIIGLLMVIALWLGMASTVFAWGQQPPPMRDGGKVNVDKMVDEMAKRLELTDQQKKDFLTIAQKTETEMRGIMAANKELQKKLGDEMQKDSPDRKVIHDYMQKINQNEFNAQLKRMDVILQLRATLTPDQQKKFKEMHQRWNERGGKHRPLEKHHPKDGQPPMGNKPPIGF